MSLLLMEGFDYYSSINALTPSMTLDSKWAFTMSSPTTQIDVSAGRFAGSQSLYMDKIGAGQDSISCVFANTSIQNVVGFAHKQVSIPSSDQEFFSFYEDSNLNSANLVFYITALNEIKVQRGLTVLGTSTPLISTDWVYIEVSVVSNNTAGSISIFADGDEKLNLTGIDTINLSTGTLNKIQFSCTTDSTYYIDDMYVATGTTLLGDSRVSVMTPVSDSGTNEWSVYPALLTDNYLAVSGSIPDYSSYIYTNLGNKKDFYNFSDLNYVPSTVYAVQPIFAARKDDLATKSIRIDIETNSGSYVDSATTLTQSTTEFYRIEGSILEINPVTTQEWTVTDLNNIQMGPETI